MRTVTVNIPDLLDLVNAADQHGYGDPIFMSAMADWAGWVTDEEIATFAARYDTPEMVAKGYGEEDAASARRELTEWRNRYCRKEEAT